MHPGLSFPSHLIFCVPELLHASLVQELVHASVAIAWSPKNGVAVKSEPQKWWSKKDPKSGGQKWSLEVAAKSGPQKWRQKVDPKIGGQKWIPKVAAKSGPQKWSKKSQTLIKNGLMSFI